MISAHGLNLGKEKICHINLAQFVVEQGASDMKEYLVQFAKESELLMNTQENHQKRNYPMTGRQVANLEGEKMTLKEKVKQLEENMQCNCDLDNWSPEPDTGHSWVCRIHKKAKELYE